MLSSSTSKPGSVPMIEKFLRLVRDRHKSCAGVWPSVQAEQQVVRADASA